MNSFIKLMIASLISVSSTFAMAATSKLECDLELYQTTSVTAGNQHFSVAFPQYPKNSHVRYDEEKTIFEKDGITMNARISNGGGRNTGSTLSDPSDPLWDTPGGQFELLVSIEFKNGKDGSMATSSGNRVVQNSRISEGGWYSLTCLLHR